MFDHLFPSLIETLRPHFVMSKTCLETLAFLLVGLTNTRTVNLSHLACQFHGPARHASTYRRLQGFFQFERLDGDIGAQLIIRLLNLSRPKLLGLERTNWKLGSRDVNVLVLAVVTRRFRVPLLWRMLDHLGNSNTPQPIALIERYLRLFGASSITALLADSEFIDAKWTKYLSKNNVLFVIRLKGDMLARFENGNVHLFHSLLRKPRRAIWRQGWFGKAAGGGSSCHGMGLCQRPRPYGAKGYQAKIPWKARKIMVPHRP